MIAQDPPTLTSLSTSNKRPFDSCNTGCSGFNSNVNSSSSHDIRSSQTKRHHRGNHDKRSCNDIDTATLTLKEGSNLDKFNSLECDQKEADQGYSETNNGNDKKDNDIDVVVAVTNDDNNNEDIMEEEDGEDPNWDEIVQHEPAKTDVPVFLEARYRREAAEHRFAEALDEAHASLKHCSDTILKIAADIFNAQRDKMIAMEHQIKHDFVDNENARSQMQTKLEQSASAAQAEFSKLMMRVTQLGSTLESKKQE